MEGDGRMGENKTVAELLGYVAYDEQGACAICEAVMGRQCDEGDCSRWALRLAGMVEAEQRAIVTAQRGSAHHIVKRWAESRGLPEFRKGESLTRWLDRCFLSRPLFEDGEPVQFGDEVLVENMKYKVDGIRVDGKGAWSICDDLYGSVRYEDGERARRYVPVMVDGRPVKAGDELWFGDEKVTARWFCDGHVMTDYTTTDTEGEEIVYPFDPSELSWERPAPKVLDTDGVPIEVGDTVYLLQGGHCDKYPLIGFVDGKPYTVADNYDEVHVLYGRICISDGSGNHGYPSPDQTTHREPDSMERIREDATKSYVDYWGCRGIGCRECPAKVDGRTPDKRYGVYCCAAMALDLVRRTEEVCGR